MQNAVYGSEAHLAAAALQCYRGSKSGVSPVAHDPETRNQGNGRHGINLHFFGIHFITWVVNVACRVVGFEIINEGLRIWTNNHN